MYTGGRISVKALPWPGTLSTRDVAAEHAREVARDGKAKTGAAVATMRAAVGLPEGFEDELLLMRGNADAGVAHGEGDVAAVGAAKRASTPDPSR